MSRDAHSRENCSRRTQRGVRVRGSSLHPIACLDAHHISSPAGPLFFYVLCRYRMFLKNTESMKSWSILTAIILLLLLSVGEAVRPSRTDPCLDANHCESRRNPKETWCLRKKGSRLTPFGTPYKETCRDIGFVAPAWGIWTKGRCDPGCTAPAQTCLRLSLSLSLSLPHKYICE